MNVRIKSFRIAHALSASVLMLMATGALSGEIKTLAWEDGEQAVLIIKTGGDAPYQLESVDDGQRQRLTFSGSTMALSLNELSGRQNVKGVYPYLSDNGNTVKVDVLMTQAGQARVEKFADGYKVKFEVNGSPTAEAVAGTASVTPLEAAPPGRAGGGAQNSIEEILYTKLPGERIQITLRMSKQPAEPSAFSITNPARVSFDFVDTRVVLPKKNISVKEGALTSITAVEAENRTRVVLSLVKPVAYTTTVDDRNFVITLQAPSATTAGADAPKTTHFASTRKSGKYSLSNIDFRRGPLGDAKIVINLSDPSVGIDIREQAGEIILDFLNTAVPAELQRRLDVIDFATPVQTIDTYLQGKNTRMVITPKGRYEHVAFQTGNVFTVSVKPIIEKPDEKKVDEYGYSGEKLSLNFQNIDVRAALQVLADFTGLNFVISDTVRGSLTLRLKDVPWDHALDLIVDSKNLAVRRKGNVVSVAPAPEVAAKEKAALEANKAVVELEPLVSELIHINYAKADEIATLLKSIKPIADASVQQHPVFGAQSTGQGAATAAATSSNSLLSPRGQVTIDARTNSILVQDTAGKLREIRKLISQLDQPMRQVMVETRLVEATDSFSRNIGSRLGHVYQGVKPNSTVTTTGNLEALEGLSATPSVYEIPSGLNVNLAAAGAGGFVAGAFSVSLQKAGKLLDLELSALEQEGKGKIISSPRVITENQKKATIEQGQERVFTTNVLGVGTVVTKKATLKLDVTPQITPDDRVNLDVVITKDNFVDAQSGLLNVKQIKTQVLLDNGDTLVIGGIYEQEKAETETKIPFFGDIPLLGWLFKNKAVLDSKTELLIFLTPRILSDKLSLR